MAGYRECASCGRRYFATDDSGFCSSSCFSSKSTEAERKPTKTLGRVSAVALFLFLFFVIESYTVNYYLLINVPFLRGHSQSVFAESTFDGVFFLHEQFDLASDPEVIALTLDALGHCTFLENYQWREKLVKDLFHYSRDENPVIRRAVVSIYEKSATISPKITLFDELRDVHTRELVFPLMERVKNPIYVDSLKNWLAFDDPKITGYEPEVFIPFVAPSEEDWLKAVDTTVELDHPALKHALLLAWIAKKAPYRSAQVKAIHSFSGLLYSLKKRNSAFKSDAARYAGQSLRVLKSIAADTKDIDLAREAQEVLTKRMKVKTGVEFEALDFFGG